jgi:predicted transposase/invertase (TIGR01784 family)
MEMEQGRYINLFTDFGFKKIFGSEFSKDILIDFLNEVLSYNEDRFARINAIKYQNPISQGQYEDDGGAVFDLYCEAGNGEKLIIELQNLKQYFFRDRALYYTSFPIQEQSPKLKNWTYELSKIYFIGILNFEMDQEGPEFVRQVKLMDTTSNQVFYDKLKMVYLEIPKFSKSISELESNFDCWMYVIKHLHTLQEKPRALQSKIFEKLFKYAEIAKLNKKERQMYDRNLKAQWDRAAVMEYATKEAAKEAAKVAATEATRETEIRKNKEFALLMKEKGEPLEKIIAYTGLNKEEIENLK